MSGFRSCKADVSFTSSFTSFYNAIRTRMLSFKTIFVFIMLSDECQPVDTVLQVFYDLVSCFSIGKTFSFVVVIFIHICSLQSSPLFFTLNVLFIA